MTPPQRRLAIALLLLGATLRLRVYLADFALRHDEAELAINLLSRSFRGLLLPLDRAQGSPVGFLWAERAMITTLGPGERAMRLIPLLAGLASLPLVAFIARRVLSPRAALLAIGLFAIADWPIHYAAEMKQYSTDLAVAAGLTALALADRGHPSRRSRAALAVAGAASVWFSHPAAFVIAAAGAWCWHGDRGGPTRDRLAAWGPIAVAWIASFAAVDALFLRSLRANRDLLGFWSPAFAPIPPRSMADVRWFGAHALEVLADPLSLPLAGVAALAFVLGAWSFWERDRRVLILLLGPAALAFFASALGKYPFSGRLILFCVPAGLIVVAEGIAWCSRVGGRRLASVVAALLLMSPTLDAVRSLLRPVPGEELRATLRAVAREGRADDPIYVYYAAEPSFAYYTRYARPPILAANPAIPGRYGRGDMAVLDADAARLAGRARVWVAFSHVVRSGGLDEEKYLLHRLDRMGRRLTIIEGFGASAYLYDLRGGS